MFGVVVTRQAIFGSICHEKLPAKKAGFDGRDRDAVRGRVESNGRAGDFVEVFVDEPLDV